MQRSQRRPYSRQKRRRGTFLRMWIQRASYTSQLDRKSMLHLPRNMHGRQAKGLDQVRRNCARWRLAGALLFASLGILLAADAPEPHHVTAVRFWSLGGVTRIAIEADGDFEVKTDHLDNPDRIFYDLTGTKPVLTN